jgi:hypothetical protein
MQLYLFHKHIFTVADYGLSLFNLNYSYLDGRHFFFMDDSAVSIQHLPAPLEGDLSCHIPIGDWIVVAKKLLPFTNWYKITLVEPLYERYVTPLEDYEF